MFTKNYSRLALFDTKKQTSSNDKGNEDGWILKVSSENSPQTFILSITLKYLDGYSCPGTTHACPIPKKVPSKRWFVAHKYTEHHSSQYDGYNTRSYISYNLSVWDNHGQKYTNTFNNNNGGQPQILTIIEDDLKYPHPLSDIVIDFIKGSPTYSYPHDNSIPTFKQKLETTFLPRVEVEKEMKELSQLRVEVEKLRALSSSQQQLITGLGSKLETLSGEYKSSQENLKDQVALTKTLQRSLEKLLDTFEKNEESSSIVVDPIALPELTCNPTQ